MTATTTQRLAIVRDIGRRLMHIASRDDSLDEIRVIDRALQRVELGHERYGSLDLAKPRDWRKERFEERLDAFVYDVCAELAAEDEALAEAREAARLELYGPPDETRISDVPERLAFADEPYAVIAVTGPREASGST